MVQKLTDYLLENPLYAYGQQQAAQGASTAPVYSPWQGLARALQGGLGGYFAGQAVQDAKGEQSLDRAALAKAMSASTPEEQDAAIASRPGIAEEAALPIMLQRSAARTKYEFEQKGIEADRKNFFGDGGAAGPAVGAAAPPAQSQGGGDPSAFIAERIKRGDDPITAAAWAANASHESGFQPGAFNPADPNGGSYGLIQWNGPRQQALRQFASSKGGSASDPAVQHDFLQSEIDANPQFKAALAAAPTAQEKAALISMQFIRPAGGQAEATARGQTASRYVPQEGAQPQAVGAGAGLAPSAAPQMGLNVPAPPAGGEMTTLKGGLQVPTAALNAALGIRDADKRHEKFTAIIQDAIKMQREGVPLVDIRRPDGSTIKVPQAQAAGMTSAREMPLPGNKEADINTLQTGDPASAEYAAAHARISQPQMSQGGQLLYPDVSAYRPPIGAKPGPGPTFKDTPASNFDMEEKMRKTFTEDPAVKNYLQVKPIMEAMQAVKNYPSKAADDNLIAGVVNLYAPGTGSLPREAMFKKIGEVENIPDALKTTIRNALSSKTGMDEHSRQILLDMAQSRLAPMQREFEARVAQHTKIAQDRGIDPAHVTILPSAAPASKEGGGAGPAPPPGFKLVTPGG